MSGSRPDRFKNILAVFLLLVIAGGLFFILERQKKLRVARDNAPTSIAKKSLKGSARPEGEATGEDDDEEDEDGVNASAVVCGPTDETPFINVSRERFLNILREQEIWAPAVAAQACFHVGKSITLVERLADEGFVYASFPRGKVKVVAIEEKRMSELENEAKYLLTQKELGHIRKMLRRRHRLTGEKPVDIKFKILRLKSENWFEERKTYGAPQTHPKARTLTLEQFNTALERGEIPYDVRPSDIFKLKTISGAANAPANIFDASQFVIQPPSELEKIKFRINYEAFSNSKNKPIIVFSSCGGDFLSYNAVTYLRKAGFKKIRWFRGGLENWLSKGKGCGTPAQVEKLSVVNAEDVRKLQGAIVKFLYVYSGKNLAGYTIKNSENLVYQQAMLGDGMAAFRPQQWDEQKFKDSKDEVDLDDVKLDSAIPLVVYGRNEYDWKPLKVALMLQAKGFKSVHWYRFGIEDWVNHALFRPQDFPTSPEFVRK